MELLGKSAFVTGGGSGIGRAAALRLAEAGADVAVLTRDGGEAAEVAAEIERLGRRSIGIGGDVTDAEGMRAAFEKIAATFGGLDIVLANAGVNGVWAPIDELTPEEWDQTIAINLRGTYLTLHHAVPHMKARGGSIVIVASINGTRTFTSAGASAYSTTKAGQLALGKMAALELARYRIRVNVVCPGAIETEIADNTEKRDAERAAVPANYPEGSVPLTGGEPGSSEDVADLILFLASNRSRHISGTPVFIDGAQSLLV